MKRILLVLVVALILSVTAWDNGVSRVTPWDYQDPTLDRGEDHPWGGEHHYVPPTVSSSPRPVTQTSFATGYFLIDFWFGHLFDVLDYCQTQPLNDQIQAEPKNHETTGSTISTKGN